MPSSRTPPPRRRSHGARLRRVRCVPLARRCGVDQRSTEAPTRPQAVAQQRERGRCSRPATDEECDAGEESGHGEQAPAGALRARWREVATSRQRRGNSRGEPCRRMTTTLTDLKQAHRAVWAAGDYAAVAEHIDAVPPRDLLDRVAIAPGEEVLDVATGTGNVALRAAAAGARVVGLDLAPGAVRRRAAARGRATASRSTGSRATRRSCRSPTRRSTTSCLCSACSSPRGTRSWRPSWRACAVPAAASGSSTGRRRA